MNAAAEYIREAIRSEQYRQALAEWNRYARQLREAVEAGALPRDQMEQARALFEWGHAALLGARAQLRARYRELEAAAAYRARPGSGEARPGLLDTRL